MRPWGPAQPRTTPSRPRTTPSRPRTHRRSLPGCTAAAIGGSTGGGAGCAAVQSGPDGRCPSEPGCHLTRPRRKTPALQLRQPSTGSVSPHTCPGSSFSQGEGQTDGCLSAVRLPHRWDSQPHLSSVRRSSHGSALEPGFGGLSGSAAWLCAAGTGGYGTGFP